MSGWDFRRPKRLNGCSSPSRTPASADSWTAASEDGSGKVLEKEFEELIRITGWQKMEKGEANGHLLEAVVFPTLEVFFTALPSKLVKKRDAKTTLFLFDLTS